MSNESYKKTCEYWVEQQELYIRSIKQNIAFNEEDIKLKKEMNRVLLNTLDFEEKNLKDYVAKNLSDE